MFKDNVKCCNCGWKGLINIGQWTCPHCKKIGCLSWVEGEPNEVDVKDLWNDNLIQFARLISELEATGCINYSNISGIADVMDLEIEDIIELIERAKTVFDKTKDKLSKRN